MSEFFPLHAHDHYSLLDGLSKPAQIAARCKALGYKGCAITNHGSINGAVSFVKAMDKAKLKPILGNEFYICEGDPKDHSSGNRSLSHLCVLAKNQSGWKSLIKATSESNSKDNFYYKPRLTLGDFAKYGGNLIAFSGHPGSQLANCLFTDTKGAYNARNADEARMFLHDDWEARATKLVGEYVEIFGKENFRIEIQRMDRANLPVVEVISWCLRIVSKKTGVKRIATPDAHYPTQADAADQRVLLATAFQTTLSAIHKKMEADDDFGMSGFFKSKNYHIPSIEEMMEHHEGHEEELAETIAIAEMCEQYSLSGKPRLPAFQCPDGMSEADYFKQLCREGWKKKIDGRIPQERKQEYVDRIKQELEVISGAGLDGYFLITQDFINWAKGNGWLVGPGRGSAAGSLAAYLSGITAVDPIRYDLLFERFYNAGRNTPGNISYPDVDSDFPISKREKVVEYIRNKFGANCVAQISTFGRMQGRGAMKDVLRAHEACSFDVMNQITEHIPDEARIADELQAMKERGESPSIITWALRENGDKLKEWCTLDKATGRCDGPLAKLFEQAIRLEGTYRSTGKHAAGVVISPVPLDEVCPMVYDRNSGTMNAGWEFEDLEYAGILKFDILGVAALDKVMGVVSILEKGRIDV